MSQGYRKVTYLVSFSSKIEPLSEHGGDTGALLLICHTHDTSVRLEGIGYHPVNSSQQFNQL